jgi:hypothetical protein
MAYTSQAQDCAQKIIAAQGDVARADLAYRRGGSLDALNAANRKLADAHDARYRYIGGVIPDKR